MDKISSVKYILDAIGMPTAQQSDLCALAVLALAKLKETDSFARATNDWIRIHDVIFCKCQLQCFLCRKFTRNIQKASYASL